MQKKTIYVIKLGIMFIGSAILIYLMLVYGLLIIENYFNDIENSFNEIF